MNKYTKGPWQVLPEEMGKRYLRVRGTQLGLRYKIADVRHVEYEGAPETEVQMTKANARLIAAAPDLLDFAIHVKSCILKNGEYAPISIQLVHELIAKATGESE